jgi:hypothetical protein
LGTGRHNSADPDIDDDVIMQTNRVRQVESDIDGHTHPREIPSRPSFPDYITSYLRRGRPSFVIGNDGVTIFQSGLTNRVTEHTLRAAGAKHENIQNPGQYSTDDRLRDYGIKYGLILAEVPWNGLGDPMQYILDWINGKKSWENIKPHLMTYFRDWTEKNYKGDRTQ